MKTPIKILLVLLFFSFVFSSTCTAKQYTTNPYSILKRKKPKKKSEREELYGKLALNDDQLEKARALDQTFKETMVEAHQNLLTTGDKPSFHNTLRTARKNRETQFVEILDEEQKIKYQALKEK